jgi:glycosyltransferase involved in cell wall biosynthesis
MIDSERNAPSISVIVPITRRHSPLVDLHAGYEAALKRLGQTCEMIYVLDGEQRAAQSALDFITSRSRCVSVVRLGRSFGESVAIMAGFREARGGTILTLPAYAQIEPVGIDLLVRALEQADMVVAHRAPRRGGPFERWRRRAFHWMVAAVTGCRFRDLGCSARAMKRIVLEEVALYGDQHRFLPVLAARRGFDVREVDVPQSPHDAYARGYRPREHAHRLLDILTLIFVVRFTKKPLRFFGMLGVLMLLAGSLLILIIVVQRLYFGVPLADRPALLLSSLLVVLGMQLFALGLLGELIIFTHGRDLREYHVAEIFSMQPQDASSELTTGGRIDATSPERRVKGADAGVPDEAGNG